jgi:hypothetical protein
VPPLPICKIDVERPFPPLEAVIAGLKTDLGRDTDLETTYGLVIAQAEMYCEPGSRFAIYRFPLKGMTELNPLDYPNVYANRGYETVLPFMPYHGTRGSRVPAILASRMVRRACRPSSSLDNRYAVCLSSLEAILACGYASSDTKLKTIFEFKFKAWKKSKRFRTSKYLYCHESWLQLQSLVLVSLGGQLDHGDGYMLTTANAFESEPPHPIRPADIADDWALPSAAFVRTYG